MIKQKKQSGFTLIELMVSVAIFTVVALMISIVFVSLAQANRRARNIKLLVDNVNFAMDSMVLELKTSTEFECVDLSDSCDSLEYTKLGSLERFNNGFKFDGEKYSINQVDRDGSEISLTSSQVKIEDLKFVLVNNDQQQKQQGVYVYVKASAQEKNTVVDFNLQTFVSARNP